MVEKRSGHKRIRPKPPKLDVQYHENSALVSPVGSRYTTEIAEVFGQSGYLDAILKTEAGSLMTISALYPKKVPRKDAKKVDSVADTKHVRLEEIQKVEAKETHHELGAIIKVLAKESGKSGRYVHYTLTSADAVETGKALQLKEGLGILIKTVKNTRDSCLAAAEEWRDVPAMMRTHGQHAIPASFGFPFAFFGYCLNKSADRLSYDLLNLVEGKLSGAIGTYDVSEDEGMDGLLIEKKTLGKLGVRPSEISLQTPPRENIAYIISDLAVLCGRLEAIASYIKTLKRAEILELKEEQENKVVSSSAMPHKNIHGNPYIEERCISVARVVRGFAVTALESMQSEDLRDLTASLADRVAVAEGFVLTDYSCRLIENIMNRIDLVPENIERNMEADRGTVASARVMSRLISKGVSREESRRIAREAAIKSYEQGRQYFDILLEDPKILEFLSEYEIKELGSVDTYIGRSKKIIDRIVSKYKGRI